MRRSRLLLLVALSGLAEALSVAALPGLDQAEANRTQTTKAQRVQRARALRRTLDQILDARDETWRWQAAMSSPRTVYAGLAERSVSVRFHKRVLTLWSQRAVAARQRAHARTHGFQVDCPRYRQCPSVTRIANRLIGWSRLKRSPSSCAACRPGSTRYWDHCRVRRPPDRRCYPRISFDIPG